MDNIYMEKTELFDCYIRDVNEFNDVFLSIGMNDEVTIIDSDVYLVTDEDGNITGLYGRNSHDIREYFNLNNVDTIKFCRRTKKGIEDVVGYDESEIDEEE